MSYRNLALLTVVAALLGLGSALSCNLTDAVTCDQDELNLAAGTHGDFGADEHARKVEAFFDSTIAVQTKAHNLMTKLTTACMNIGRALGLADSAMQPASTEASDADRIRAACNPVATEIGNTIRQALPSGAHLSLTYVPPECTGSFDAYASCAGRCDVSVTPGELDVDCEPGSIGIGECGASCSGQCWVDASAGCTGTCTATCTGTCSGACYGTCSAGCAYEDSPGHCAGACTGTCTGRCDAQCSGSCDGECWAEVDGGCTGECHGECDVWVTPPRCDVYARPPEVDAECHASCQASVSASLTCTEPSLTIDYGLLGGSTDAQNKLRALIPALRDNYPDVLQATIEAGGAIVDMVGAFFDALSSFGDVVTNLLDAAACVAVAVTASVSVSATFTASFDATVSVTGSVGVAGGGA